MKYRSFVTVVILTIILWGSGCSVGSDDSSEGEKPLVRLCLWYDRPAEDWESEALPVGNGRLGAMVFGGVQEERILLNEDTIWAGPPVPEARIESFRALKEARELFFEGLYGLGQQVVQDRLMSPRIAPRSYQPLGDLRLKFELEGEVSDYRRELDLETAIATTRFTQGDATFSREVFSSPVDQVIVVSITADKGGKITLEAALDRPADYTVRAEGPDRLVMFGQASQDGKHKGVKYETQLQAKIQGGEITAKEKVLRIVKADAAVLLLAAATDYNHARPKTPHTHDLGKICRDQLAAAGQKSYQELRKDHIAEHQRLFKRVELDLGVTAAANMPTDQRLEAVKDGQEDPQLIALYFQYGRYLLICSSRPGCMPANLQGLWNPHLEAPWNSDYHLNINLQMNYWPAEVGNLSECHEPFFDLIERLRPSGRITARLVFYCPGFTANHVTDAWLFTAPTGHASWGMWPMGAAWCTQHFMEHYRFTGDREFLAERAYPILIEASMFLSHWLVEDPKTGKLVSGPTTSPENSFIAPDGNRVNLSMGTSMDQQIIWETFNNVLEAAEILGIDDEKAKENLKEVAEKREKLFLPGIGSDGRLMEWSEEFKEPEPGHRHMSHLFGVYPGRQYTFKETPEYMAAARKSIEYRLAHGGGHTGWSRAWIINFWARLQEGEKAYENVLSLLQKSTLNNLLDTHPPFQIDGNFGGTAGIAEMILQSHADELHLLPAAPKAWADGRVKGLVARGGFVVDMEWKEGKPTTVKIHAKVGGICKVRYQDKVIELTTEAGKSYDLKDFD
ncbi:MAG: hypothetical protein AMJ79_05525 [Phycisphaerae bacterium SM23_30]|nr:MAG: hypothetical protein AMJ79_05525 [Phycisphaerae bacterium SM23_30]